MKKEKVCKLGIPPLDHTYKEIEMKTRLYYISNKQNLGFCFVTSKKTMLTSINPAFYR